MYGFFLNSFISAKFAEIQGIAGVRDWKTNNYKVTLCFAIYSSNLMSLRMPSFSLIRLASNSIVGD